MPLSSCLFPSGYAIKTDSRGIFFLALCLRYKVTPFERHYSLFILRYVTVNNLKSLMHAAIFQGKISQPVVKSFLTAVHMFGVIVSVVRAKKLYLFN